MSDDPRRIKQVICMRHDLRMRSRQRIAQYVHASMVLVTRRLQKYGHTSLANCSPAERAWLAGGFARVCCRVNG